MSKSITVATNKIDNGTPISRRDKKRVKEKAEEKAAAAKRLEEEKEKAEEEEQQKQLKIKKNEEEEERDRKRSGKASARYKKKKMEEKSNLPLLNPISCRLSSSKLTTVAVVSNKAGRCDRWCLSLSKLTLVEDNL